MALGQLKIATDGDLCDKVEIAIKRLKAFCPPEGYYVAFSGGKDSQCVYHLCKMAGVKFDAHYCVTSIDPPELVRFIKKNYPDVKFEHKYGRNGKPVTMWTLIPEKGIPPTRTVRYCCEELKESSGEGRFTVTGVRAAESGNRKRNQGVITVPKAGKKFQKTLEEEKVNFTQTPRGGGAELRQRREPEDDGTLHQNRESTSEPHHRLGRRGCVGIPERKRYRALLPVRPGIQAAWVHRMPYEYSSSSRP